MKTFTLACVTSLFLFNNSVLAETGSWSARSTEKQFENRSAKIEKSSEGSEAKSKTSGANTLQKGTSTQSTANLQSQAAFTLLARPQVQNLDHEFWIYDAQVTLYSDEDYDGYYHHFSVEFDADTVFEHADVYARLYLGSGDVFQEYHTTSVFHIDGESSEDGFEVDSELLTGFPSADYEVLIELYDAFNDELVATYDGNNDADLYSLSLESYDFDKVYAPPPVVIVHENGGSMAYLSLLLFSLMIVRFRRKLNVSKL
jgi:hypothetical protein